MYIYDGILLSHEKNEILPFATTWMEIIVLSEVSQRNTVWYHLHVESKNYNKAVNQTKKQQTHRHKKQTRGDQWGEGRRVG